MEVHRTEGRYGLTGKSLGLSEDLKIEEKKDASKEKDPKDDVVRPSTANKKPLQTYIHMHDNKIAWGSGENTKPYKKRRT